MLLRIYLHQIRSSDEYDRMGDYDPDYAKDEWQYEEEEEELRQLHVRWEYLERDVSFTPREK